MGNVGLHPVHEALELLPRHGARGQPDEPLPRLIGGRPERRGSSGASVIGVLPGSQPRRCVMGEHAFLSEKTSAARRYGYVCRQAPAGLLATPSGLLQPIEDATNVGLNRGR
jgi:hypothetical protein